MVYNEGEKNEKETYTHKLDAWWLIRSTNCYWSQHNKHHTRTICWGRSHHTTNFFRCVSGTCLGESAWSIHHVRVYDARVGWCASFRTFSRWPDDRHITNIWFYSIFYFSCLYCRKNH